MFRTSLLSVLIACLPAAGAELATQYFIAPYAGYTPGPPAAVPIALNQYLGEVSAIACSALGVVYYATDTQVFRLNADGTDTLIAGSSSTGGTFVPGEAAVNAFLPAIIGLAFDPQQQNLYIVENGGNCVFKVSLEDGTISIFAGNGSEVTKAGLNVGPGIPATATPLNVNSIAVGGDGTVYVSTTTNPLVDYGIVSFSADGQNSALLAGNFISPADYMAISGSLLYADLDIYEVAIDTQTGSVSQFLSRLFGFGGPFAIGANGLIYTSTRSGAIEEVNPGSGTVTPVPGGGDTLASGVALNPATGDLLLYSPGIVQDLSPSGSIRTIAGYNYSGDDGPAALAVLQGTTGLGADSSGNLYLFDYGRIRKVTPSSIITTIAGTGIPGDTGDGGKALDAEVAAADETAQVEIAADRAGDLYFLNNLSGDSASIREIDLNGNISTIAGGGSGTLTNGATATGLTLNPGCLAVDPEGDVYFGQGEQVYEIVSGQTMLVAGKGKYTASVTNGTAAITAGLGSISGLAADGSGNLYIGDSEHGMIWLVNPQGIISLYAGISVSNPADVSLASGPATSVSVGQPENLVLDGQGNLYFYPNTVNNNPEIAAIDASDNLTLIAGVSTAKGTDPGSTGDGSNANMASFTQIWGLAADASGSVYVADGKFLVRKMSLYDPNSPPPFISTGGVIGAGGSVPPVGAISTGGIVSIFGANFVSAANQHTVGPGDLVNGQVPTQLAGVCVNFGSTPAAMLGVYPNQLNVQVGTLTASAVTVQVITNCGTGSATASNFSGAPVQFAAPEFFSFKPDPAAGNNPVAAVDKTTGIYVGTPGLLSGATFAAANPGDIIEAYGTGWGPTMPAFGLGVIPGAAATLSSAYSLTLGGTPVPAADILYAGVSPCCAGLYQLDFTVPAGTAGGNLPLVLTVAGEPSPPAAFIAVQ